MGHGGDGLQHEVHAVHLMQNHRQRWLGHHKLPRHCWLGLRGDREDQCHHTVRQQEEGERLQSPSCLCQSAEAACVAAAACVGCSGLSLALAQAGGMRGCLWHPFFHPRLGLWSCARQPGHTASAPHTRQHLLAALLLKAQVLAPGAASPATQMPSTPFPCWRDRGLQWTLLATAQSWAQW